MSTKNMVIVRSWALYVRSDSPAPYGFSLHLTESDMKQFISAYQSKMPDTAPDTYAQPTSRPAHRMRVSDELFTQVKNSENGIRTIGEKAPGTEVINSDPPVFERTPDWNDTLHPEDLPHFRLDDVGPGGWIRS